MHPKFRILGLPYSHHFVDEEKLGRQDYTYGVLTHTRRGGGGKGNVRQIATVLVIPLNKD